MNLILSISLADFSFHLLSKSAVDINFCSTMSMIGLAKLLFFCFCVVVREHRELGVYVDKLTKHIVTDVSEVFGLIGKGKKNR